MAALVIAARPASALDLGEIKPRGTLRVIAAADEAAETFSFTSGPNPGFDRELVEGFAKLHGLRVEPVKAKSYGDRSRGKIAWAVRKSDADLRAALDEYLGNVRRGPSWSRLIVKYFGDQALQVLGKGK